MQKTYYQKGRDILREKVRGFEIVSEYQDKGIELPQRQTKYSAGYDLAAAEEVELPSFWSQAFKVLLHQFKLKMMENSDQVDQVRETLFKPTLVPTGLKIYMQEDEYVKIVNRSSGSYKHFSALPNGIGIIDADYYNNEKNEGHVYVQLINFGMKTRKIKKGERIAQAIFCSYLKVDQDQLIDTTRQGGFGSSD